MPRHAEGIRAKIVHISDLHFGVRFFPAYFDKLLSETLLKRIADHEPDHIICTGDVIDFPLDIWALRAAKAFFDGILQACKTKPQIHIVPGNHDVAFFGSFGFKPLTGLLFRRYFKDYFVLDQPRIDNSTGVVIFGIDSNPNIAWMARGKIKRTSLFRIASGELTGSRAIQASNGFQNDFVIAIVHHHPLPIPYSGRDSLMVLNDAGALLYELAKADTDLVLHGHRHFFSFSKIKFYREDGEYEIPVLSAGAAANLKPDDRRGSSYNLLTLWVDGSITCNSYFAPDGQSFQSSRGTISCRTSEEACVKVLRRNRQRAQYSAEDVRFSVGINRYGDARYAIQYSGFRVGPQRQETQFTFRRTTDYGYFREAEVCSVSPRLARLSVQIKVSKEPPKDKKDWLVMEAVVDFGEMLRSDDSPVDFQLSFWLYAAFAMSMPEQSLRRSIHIAGYEGVLLPNDIPTARLSAVIKFEPGGITIDPETIGVFVRDTTQQRQHGMEEKAKAAFRVANHCIEAEILNPRPGFSYEVIWKLPSPSASRESEILRERARTMRRRLCALRSARDQTGFEGLQNYLESIRKEFSSSYGSGKPEEQFDVSLMSLDEGSACLRLVAGRLAPTDRAWLWELPAGYGIAGRAFKANEVVFYSRSLKPERTPDIYIRPGDPLKLGEGAFDHEVLIAAPVRLGNAEKEGILGILNLGTNDHDTPLNLALREEGRRRELKLWLSGVCVALQGYLMSVLEVEE